MKRILIKQQHVLTTLVEIETDRTVEQVEQEIQTYGIDDCEILAEEVVSMKTTPYLSRLYAVMPEGLSLDIEQEN